MKQFMQAILAIDEEIQSALKNVFITNVGHPMYNPSVHEHIMKFQKYPNVQPQSSTMGWVQ